MRARTIDKVYFLAYYKRAREFSNAMYDEAVLERYNASALLGIHATIALIDSLLLYESGRRSAEEGHSPAVTLLTRVCAAKKLKDISGTKRFSEIISRKNHIAYSEHYRADCFDLSNEIRMNVERCFNWAYRNFESWNKETERAA